MTWSILARDPKTGLSGLAIASKFFAVGAMCLGAKGKVGAVSTQALMNPTYANKALIMLGDGTDPASVVTRLTAPDTSRDHRQVHVLDAQGGASAYTGASCIDWCGHLGDENISVAGNMLAGPEVVANTLETFKANADMPMVERLLLAMEAGEAAGGDKRGKQSAAIMVQGDEDYTRFSIRADDHADPLAELRRLNEVAKERFIPFSACFPTADRPDGIFDRPQIEAIH